MRKVQLIVLSCAILFSFIAVLRVCETPLTRESVATEPALMSPLVTTNYFSTFHDSNGFGTILSFLGDSSPYLSSVMWVFFLASLAFKGKTKSLWHDNGLDYDIFRILLKMRGGISRIEIMEVLSLPKNKLQIAKSLSMDWRSIDNHVNILLKNNLIDEMATVGTSKYYILTRKGKNVMSLIKKRCISP